jgi:hypothetical protein
VYELENEMPLHEVFEWRSFWKLKAEAEKKAYDKAKREAETGRGARRR